MVTLGVFALSAVVVIIIAFTPYYDYTVATGAALGALGASLNFMFLGFVVSKAVEKDESKAGSYVQATYTVRLLFMAAIIIHGIKLPYFIGYATAFPFLLTRPVIMLVNFIFKKRNDSNK